MKNIADLIFEILNANFIHEKKCFGFLSLSLSYHVWFWVGVPLDSIQPQPARRLEGDLSKPG